MSMEDRPIERDEQGNLTNDSPAALVAYASASPTPSEMSDVGTPSGSQRRASSAPGYLPPDQAALAWIDHVERGNSVPDGPTFVALMRALVAPRVPQPPVTMASLAGVTGVRLVLVDTSHNKKFPHMLDTSNGRLTEEEAIWTQCKTKMTHVAVRLVDSKGAPVKGRDVQEGGLVLRLTLHKVSDFEEALHDGHNPRPWEGLFLGRASQPFEPEVCMIEEGRHEFRFQVMLLSSDIAGARMFVKVAPVDPQLAINPNLTVQSHSFISRARMPDDFSANNAKRARAAGDLLSMAMTMADAQAAAAEDSEADARAASP